MSGAVELAVAGIDDERRAAFSPVIDALDAADRVVLTTHVNADGDGAGSEVALGAWLGTRGTSVTIVNPTPFPDVYRFLTGDVAVAERRSEVAAEALESADLLVVLDTSEPKRIGALAKAAKRLDTVVIDHHPASDEGLDAVAAIQDAAASATGELIYEMLLIEAPDEIWPAEIGPALYTAILTDTGSFRFSNTTPKTHRMAAELIRRGLDPEAMHQQLYGNVPLHRVRLLELALANLSIDAEHGVSWIEIPPGAMEELGATSQDLDGVIDHARAIEGTRVALLMRQVNGSTKLSFRSTGSVDVNALAREFGGGGHVKAAGALISGPLESNRQAVLDAVREAAASLEPTPPGG